MSTSDNVKTDLELSFLLSNTEKAEFSHYNSRSIHNNITSTFTGIGYLIFDINGFIYSALQLYDLDKKDIPSLTIVEHFKFIVENLASHSLKDIVFFYQYTNDDWINSILSVLLKAIKLYLEDIENKTYLSKPRFFNFIQFDEFIAEERVSIVISSLFRTNLINHCSTLGMYIGLFESLVFNTPFAYSNVLLPYKYLKENIKYEKFSEFNLNLPECVVDLNPFLSTQNFDINNINNEFMKPLDTHAFKNMNIKIPKSIANDIFIYNLKDENCLLFDGRIFYNVEKLRYEISSKIPDFFIPDFPWCGKDLDLIISPVIDGMSFKHLANVRKSAQSMHNGKFQYSNLVKESKEQPKKISAKMQKIIDQNTERIRKEKEKVNNNWLKEFYNNFSKLPNVKAKKNYIEAIKNDNEYINEKLSLLKIELYLDIWNLEKRCETINEKVLIPLYLECLDYIEKRHAISSLEEINFVLNKLAEGGFEATTKELIEKYKLNERFKDKTGNPLLKIDFKTNATSSPNDLDLYFQLKYAGEHLKRTLGTSKDSRVPFDPDRWQVKLLDTVDSSKSAVVAAPTSSGKTFICFYAIEKILRNSDTDVVVFCLPTKALVNQVSADVYARFNPKNCKTMLQGTLMNDRSNDPFNCQVLITIPNMLESLLASRDCSNIKYIIIDEVHKINDESLGLRIERIIHLSKAPLLLLSATIGNLSEFFNWFQTIENSKGRQCELVLHNERFCELKPFVYKERPKIPASSLETHSSDKEDRPLEENLIPLNGMIAYSHSHLKQFGFGNDLNFLPEELLNIYYYIYIALDKDKKKLIKNLAPKKFFTSNIICKADIKKYQEHLLKTFEEWVKDGILTEHQVSEIYSLLVGSSLNSFPLDTSEEYLTQNILELLNSLKDKNMLPVIVFNTDRELVTRLAINVYRELEKMDATKRKDKAFEKAKKEAKRNRDAEKSKDSWIEDSIMAEQFVEPESKDIKYTFLDPLTKLTEYEVNQELNELRSYPKEILDMAHRGIGIHHAALGKKYRSAIEILFRKKHVRVLFATETLALGINMPCRTVVFAGDSLQLDPMNYKQMSGRAGRRGYDTLGNVVFMGIPKSRVQNLLVSMLPNIQGSYSFSNTSFLSFNIENSLLENPLLALSYQKNTGLTSKSTPENNGSEKQISKKLEALSLKENIYTFNLLINKEKRQFLLNYQKSKYSFIYPSTFLWDLYISSRECDPSIFIFAMLLLSDSISWQQTDFINTLAHIFEIRPFCLDPAITLPPLPEKTSTILQSLIDNYKDTLIDIYPTRLKSLQMASKKPLQYIKSFLYYIDAPKNSYILDFFNHGSPVTIELKNHVSQGDLWQSLYIIDQFMKNLLKLLENIFGSDDDRFKKLKIIYTMFNGKFKAMFA